MHRAGIPLLAIALACTPTPDTRRAEAVVLDSSIANLEMLRDSLPDLYPAARALYTLSAQMGLASLGYGPSEFTGIVDPPTVSATRQFEASKGLPVTGNPFAKATFARLSRDVKRVQMLELATVSHRWFDASGWEQGFVSATGPWIAPGMETPAAARIECTRRQGECVVVEAELGEEQLVPSLDRFTILTWDRVEIRSSPIDTPCQRTVLEINRIEATVSLRRTTLSSSGVLCNSLARDSETVYNQNSHLATNAEIAVHSARSSALLFDSLVSVSSEAAHALSILRDTAALHRALQPVHH